MVFGRWVVELSLCCDRVAPPTSLHHQPAQHSQVTGIWLVGWRVVLVAGYISDITKPPNIQKSLIC